MISLFNPSKLTETSAGNTLIEAKTFANLPNQILRPCKSAFRALKLPAEQPAFFTSPNYYFAAAWTWKTNCALTGQNHSVTAGATRHFDSFHFAHWRRLIVATIYKPLYISVARFRRGREFGVKLANKKSLLKLIWPQTGGGDTLSFRRFKEIVDCQCGHGQILHRYQARMSCHHPRN